MRSSNKHQITNMTQSDAISDYSELMFNDSASVVHSGVSNTQTPSSRVQGKQYPHWIITLKYRSNSADSADSANSAIVHQDLLYNWIKQHCTYASWQLEKGDEEDYLHWQIAIKLKVRQRFTWLKRHFSQIAHIENIRNIDAADAYCHKVETRVQGPYFFPEPVEPIIDYFIEEKCVPKWWQLEILELIKTRPSGRKIHWYYEGTGNVGKSTFVGHLDITHNAFILGNAKLADIAFAFSKKRNSQNTVVFDIPRSGYNHINYYALECILNGRIFSSKYESGMVRCNRTHLIIFANFPPEQNEHTMSADRWVIKDISE